MINDQIDYVIGLLLRTKNFWDSGLYHAAIVFVNLSSEQLNQLKEMINDEISRLQKN